VTTPDRHAAILVLVALLVAGVVSMCSHRPARAQEEHQRGLYKGVERAVNKFPTDSRVCPRARPFIHVESDNIILDKPTSSRRIGLLRG
jgi:hypothetical protein